MENRILTDKELAAVLGATVSVLLIIIIIYTQLTTQWKEILAFNIVLCFVAGMLGRERRIGFGLSYILSLVLSPVIGFVIALSSKRK